VGAKSGGYEIMAAHRQPTNEIGNRTIRADA